MSVFTTLKSEFQSAFPRLASGKYVHFILLRHSQSFPVFQTDGILNTARTQAGLGNTDESKKQRFFRTCYAKITITEEGTGNGEQGTVKKRTKFSVCLA